MERVGDRQEKMEGHCSTGQNPQWAVVLMEEEEEELKQIMSELSTAPCTCTHNSWYYICVVIDISVFK